MLVTVGCTMNQRKEATVEAMNAKNIKRILFRVAI